MNARINAEASIPLTADAADWLLRRGAWVLEQLEAEGIEVTDDVVSAVVDELEPIARRIKFNGGS